MSAKDMEVFEMAVVRNHEPIATEEGLIKLFLSSAIGQRGGAPNDRMVDPFMTRLKASGIVRELQKLLVRPFKWIPDRKMDDLFLRLLNDQ